MQSRMSKADGFVERVRLYSAEAGRQFELVASSLISELAGERDQPSTDTTPTLIDRDDEGRDARQGSWVEQQRRDVDGQKADRFADGLRQVGRIEPVVRHKLKAPLDLACRRIEPQKSHQTCDGLSVLIVRAANSEIRHSDSPTPRPQMHRRQRIVGIGRATWAAVIPSNAPPTIPYPHSSGAGGYIRLPS
jgi:hypothetical protein